MTHRRIVVFCAAVMILILPHPVMAQNAYGPGVTDTEIKIGQTMPYSGPASAYGAIGKAEAAYLRMVNDQGGVNGRKITLLSLDDSYSPPKTVEQTRKLVEQENVLLLFQSLGTAANTAIQKYLNEKKVPQLFVASGATKWADPEHFRWTMGWQPSYQAEARIYARYILETKPHAKIGILYQNDDYGKDYLKGMKDGLGDRAASMIVKEVSYEVTDPTIDSQIVSLQASGADVFFNVTTPKFAAQAIRKAYDIGWKPVHFLNGVSVSRSAVLAPAGFEKAKDIITSIYLIDPNDPQWSDEPESRVWSAWMDKYNPEGNKADAGNVYGYALASTLVQVLNQCGDNLTRENVMAQAANLKGFRAPMLLPGITINTSPSDYAPVKQMQLARFDGEKWVPFGEVLGVDR